MDFCSAILTFNSMHKRRPPAFTIFHDVSNFPRVFSRIQQIKYQPLTQRSFLIWFSSRLTVNTIRWNKRRFWQNAEFFLSPQIHGFSYISVMLHLKIFPRYVFSSIQKWFFFEHSRLTVINFPLKDGTTIFRFETLRILCAFIPGFSRRCSFWFSKYIVLIISSGLQWRRISV